MFDFLKGLLKKSGDITLVTEKKHIQREFKELWVVKHSRVADELFQQLVESFEHSHGGFGLNSDLIIAHFWAQMAHETGGFRWLRELGGPKYFQRYEGRKDLGNTKPGDGVKYHGRGIIHITGRYNYDIYGQKIGKDLINNPELAEKPDVAMLIALHYWQDRGINAKAARDDVKAVTRAINGGLNGLPDRKHYLRKLKKEFKI